MGVKKTDRSRESSSGFGISKEYRQIRFGLSKLAAAVLFND
jgi:hypothetical protein